MKRVYGIRWRGGSVVALLAAAAMVASACGSSNGGNENTGGDTQESSSPTEGDGAGTGSIDASESNAPQANQSASPRASEDKLVAIAVQDPGNFDYVKDVKTALALWIPSIVEPLVYFDADNEATPGVSDKWEISDDGTVYTFHIRDTEFSDGTTVTADDVVFSLKQMQSSPVVKNSSPYDAVTDIEKTDDHTVKVTLSRPSQSFFHGMGSTAGMIQPKSEADKRASHPIGTGPYKLVKYVPQDSIVLTANENYWGDQPAIPDVTIKIIEDENAAMLALQAGEADMFAPAGAQFWSQITKEGLDKTYNLITYPQSGEPTYGIINSKLPLEERRTIAATFNRDDIKAVFNAPWGIKTACTFASANRSWFVETDNNGEDCYVPFDPDQAAADVGANGYGDSELEFTSLTDVGDLKPPAEVMIAELQAAGFNVKNNAVDLSRYSTIVFSSDDPDFDVTVMAGSDNPAGFTCPDGHAGYQTYCSDEYDALLEKADTSLTTEDYDKYMKQAAETLAKDAVIVPMLSKQGVGLLNPALQGWEDPNVNVGIRLADLHW